MELRPTLIFLDLEEVCIDSWASGTLLLHHLERIKLYLDRQFAEDPHGVRIGLMSWAVSDHHDKITFNKDLRWRIEQHIGTTFQDRLVWSMDEWAQVTLLNTGLKLDREDLFDFCRKEDVLFKMARKGDLFRNRRVVLIDDAVLSTTVTIPSRNLTLEIIRLDDLPAV